MPLVLSPEQELVAKVTSEFAQRTVEPDATRTDRERAFPSSHVAPMARLGLLGMLVPAADGGSEADTVSLLLAIEAVARAGGTDAVFLVLQNALVGRLLASHGTDEQKRRWLGPSLTGDALVALAATEEASGASMDAMKTRLEPTDGGFEVRGAKSFVALAPIADHLIVLARTREGPTMVVVERRAANVHIGPDEPKMGLRGLPLCDVYFNRVPVASTDILGAAGGALDSLSEPMALARLGVSAALVGMTQRCLDMAIAFSKERHQFGRPIATFGAIGGMLADVHAELDAARATAYEAAALRDAGKPFIAHVYEARLLAHRIAVKGSRIAHKVHGGAGFMRDLPLERFSRDIRTAMHLWDAQDIARGRLATILLGR